MRGWIAAGFALMLVGCSTQYGADAKISHSGFDDATVVTIPLHGADCKSMFCPMLGYQWVGNDPDTALVTAGIANKIVSVSAAQLKINGDTITLQPSGGATDFSPAGSPMKESTNLFTTDLSVLKRLSSSDDAWLRITTNDGYYDAQVADGVDNSKAFYATKRFLQAVEQAR